MTNIYMNLQLLLNKILWADSTLLYSQLCVCNLLFSCHKCCGLHFSSFWLLARVTSIFMSQEIFPRVRKFPVSLGRVFSTSSKHNSFTDAMLLRDAVFFTLFIWKMPLRENTLLSLQLLFIPEVVNFWPRDLPPSRWNTASLEYLPLILEKLQGRW